VTALAPGFESTNSTIAVVTTPPGPPIVNWSFENQSVAACTYTSFGSGAPAGWSSSGVANAVVAIVDPCATDNRGFSTIPPPGMDGNNYAQIYVYTGSGGGTVYQDLGANNQYQAGTTYHLTAAFGKENGNFATGSTMCFYNSSLTVVTSTVISSASLTLGAFTDITLTYTATGKEGGNGDIVVGFNVPTVASTAFFDFDNVRLVASVPSSSPPVITTQPASQTNSVGATVSFSVGTTGTAPLSYQWQAGSGGTYSNLVDGPQVSGSASNVLTIANVTANWALSYQVIVTNIAGAVTSAPSATLTVNSPMIGLQANGQGGLVLTWSGGSLLQATNVLGPWTTNSTATSPLTVTPNAGVQQQFYRVQSP
jgi:hypothetical protein